MSAITIHEVTKTFGKVLAVDRLSLAVPEGCVYGFIGPNGSGKTTTIRMIMNILQPDSGDIRILGGRLGRSDTDRIGYMPEERGLYTRMKVGELLRFYGTMKSGRDVRADVTRWLERLELSDWADKKLEALSKGMGQKVQFIATVVARPEIVILDEPFTGLDPVNQEAIKEAVLELQSAGTTVIFSTHDMNVAEQMCDFIFMIFRGRKVLDGTLADIQDQYGSDTVRIRTEGGSAVLAGVPGVERMRDSGQTQELRLARDADPQRILREIVARTRVKHFELVKPSLHDIFIRIAGPEAREVNHA